MLLVLKHEDGTTYFLLSGKNYLVGRRNADILIENDRSVSKNHAVIKVGNAFATVTDAGSTYKTFVNDKAIDSDVPVTLRVGNVLKFGALQSIFLVEDVNIVTTGSGLNTDQKIELKENITWLKGSVLSNWSSNCTHLTVDKVMLTIKVLDALIDNKPIVNLEYWRQVVDRTKNKKVLPKVEKFRPPLAENLLNDVTMTYNPKRKELFNKKVIVFPDGKILSKMKEIVEKCGGSCLCWTKNPVSLSEIESSDKYIVIQSDDKPTQSLLQVHETLNKLGKRTIPIQEIAMAILHCSCERDCNPNFSRVDQVFLKQETNCPSQVYTLAAETPTQQSTTQPKQEIVIPSSLESNPLDLFPNSTSKVSSDNNINDPKPSCSNRVTCEIGLFKRTATGSYNNPLKKMKMEMGPPTPEQPQLLRVLTNESSTQQSLSLERTVNKRKADTPLTQPNSKKSATKPNPFASSVSVNRPSVSANNPFFGLRVKVESTLDDNPFMIKPANTTVAKNETINTTVEKIEYPSAVFSNESKIVSSSGWSTTSSIVVKIDEELREIYESFRNTVVLARMAPIARRIINDSIDSVNTTVNGKNFKKFRKVAPLRPQTRIIVTTGAQNVAGSFRVDQHSAGEEEEEDIPRSLPKPPVKKTKRFNF